MGILLTVFVSVAAQLPAQSAPSTSAVDECRVLVQMEVLTRAVERCEEATRLDPKSPDAYFLLGFAYNLAWREPNSRLADDVKRSYQQKAIDNLTRFLALNREDTEWRRGMVRPALAVLIELYALRYEKDPAALEPANRLAQLPALERGDLLALISVYWLNDRLDLSEKMLKRQLQADPKDAEACGTLATLYNQPVWNGARFDDLVATLEQCAAITPSDPAGYYWVAVFLWDKTTRDKGLSPQQTITYIDRGLINVNRALAIKKDLFEAVIYKALLLRAKASVSDMETSRRLIGEATDLGQQSLALRKARTDSIDPRFDPPMPPPPPGQVGGVKGGVVGGVVGGIVGAPPPPPPPPAAPVRVGGDIKPPAKIKDVPPVYPAIAQSARVQGIVIVEATIGPDGLVKDTKVVRSIPLLDAAALDSVRQSVFAPTLLNGVPVPVIMSVTVTFTLK